MDAPSSAPPSAHAFVPMRRAALVDAVTSTLGARAAHARQTAQLVSAAFHVEARAALETLKARYAALDPDNAREDAKDDVADALTDALERALVRANFRRLSDDAVRASVLGEGIFPVSYDVDLGKLAHWEVWVRGESCDESTRARFFGLFREKVRFDVHRRVFVSLRFLPPKKSRLRAIKERLFPPRVEHVHRPSRVYLKLIRNVPKQDLEIVFPDPVPRMKNAQVLQVAIPFVAGVSLLVWEWVLKPIVDGTRHAPASEAVITAIAIALAGHAVKTVQSYRSAVQEFLNEVTHSLYFRSVALNGGVLQWLIDASEEEDAKETWLALVALDDGAATCEELSRRATTLVRRVVGSDVPALALDEGLAHLVRMGVATKDGDRYGLVKDEVVKERLRRHVMSTLEQ